MKTNKVKSEDLHFLESFQLSIYYKYYVRILFQVKIIEMQMQRFIELHKDVPRCRQVHQQIHPQCQSH